jgi:hypothetical protein
MTKKGKHIASTNDPFGNIVITTSTTWKHIEEKHPEMAGKLNDVQGAIASPDAIRPSTLVDTAFGLEKSSAGETIRVLVDYGTPDLFDGTSQAYVSTAYPDDPAIPSAVGDTIWTSTSKTTVAESKEQKDEEQP